MLNIKKFVQGKDEKVWIKIWNEAFKEYDDERAKTMQDIRIWENSPRFNATGMFIAEWNSKPVGIVQAYVDKNRKEKKGSIRILGVIPKFRRKGIGKKLLETAIESFKERGMDTAEGWARDKASCMKLHENMGFKQVRVFSIMKRNLKTIPLDMEQNEDIKLRTVNNNMEDIKLLNWLDNETFKEHYNFRPHTMEETKYMIENYPDINLNGWFFAYLKNKPVGYVSTQIDKKFIEEKGIKQGWIRTIGVLKSHRKKGIGTKLMLTAMQFLKTKGMTEAVLHVDDANPTKAIELYKKVGFKIDKKQLSYLKNIK